MVFNNSFIYTYFERERETERDRDRERESIKVLIINCENKDEPMNLLFLYLLLPNIHNANNESAGHASCARMQSDHCLLRLLQGWNSSFCI